MSRRGDGARRACSAKRSVSWKSRKLPSGIHDDETALQVLESVELDDFRECKAGGIWGPLWPVDSPSIIIPPHNSDSDDWDSSPASSEVWEKLDATVAAAVTELLERNEWIEKSVEAVRAGAAGLLESGTWLGETVTDKSDLLDWAKKKGDV